MKMETIIFLLNHWRWHIVSMLIWEISC